MSDDYPSQRRTFRKYNVFIIQYLILSLIVLFVIVPAIMMIFAALKTRADFMATPYTFPIPPSFENFKHVLGMKSFWIMLWNSLWVMITMTIGLVVISSMAAFALSRVKFRGQSLFFSYLSLGLMFPITIAIVPLYLVIRQMNLIDNLWSVVMVQIAFQLSISIVILRNSFAAIPKELQNASYIDGCSAFSFFWRILIPLSRPALATVASLAAVYSWNDLLTPLVFINMAERWTLPLGTMQFQGQYSVDLALVSAFVVLSAIPAIIFYLFAQKQLISGLISGSLKG